MSFTIRPETSTAQWHDLVTEAEAEVGIRLDEEVESYLVFLLMRFTSRPEIADSILALDYLHSLDGSRQQQKENMRDVGDKCLLYAGFFPKRAEKRLVKISYYVDLGRSAYHHVAGHSMAALADLFAHLAQEFVAVMDTLQAIQQINPENQLKLNPIEATELWQDTGSLKGRQRFSEFSSGFVVRSGATDKRH